MNYIKTSALLVVLSCTTLVMAQSTSPDSRCPDCSFTDLVFEGEVINPPNGGHIVVSLTMNSPGRRSTFSIPYNNCGATPEAGNTIYLSVSGIKKYGPRTGLDRDECYVNAVQITSVSHLCEIPAGLQTICPDEFPFVW